MEIKKIRPKLIILIGFIVLISIQLSTSGLFDFLNGIDKAATNNIILSPNEKFIGWSGRLTGNESIYYNLNITGNRVCITPKFTKDEIIQECDNIINETTFDIISSNCKNITYIQPTSIKLGFENGTSFSVPKLQSSTLCYNLNPERYQWLKIGESSIILTADYSYNSTDSNITQEQGFAHLNISKTAPYDSLVLYYPFDDGNRTGANTTVQDFSPNGINGVLQGNATSNATGVYGPAYSGDGIGDRVSIPIDQDLNMTSKTVTFWANIYTLKNFNMVYEDDNQRYAAFGASGTGQLVVAYRNSTSGSNRFFTFNNFVQGTNQWFFYAVSYNITGVISNVTAYRNGDLIDSQENIDGYIGDPILAVGDRKSLGANSFNGTIDEFMIFNITLTPAHILDIYNNQSARYLSQGEQEFRNQNLSTAGTENRVNISLDKYAHLMNSNISVSVNRSFFNLSDAGAVNNLQFETDPNYQNITFRYNAGNETKTITTSPFYSPLILGNITLTSWYESGAPPADSCTPPAGNWALICADNCTFTANANINGNVTITGNGNLTFKGSNWSFTIKRSHINISKSCMLNISKGSSFNVTG